jgi:hypothetical protein
VNELFKQAKIDYPKLSKIVRHLAGTNLSYLSEPCFYPTHKNNYFELLNACTLTAEVVKSWVKGFWKGMPQADWDLQNDPSTMLNIFLMWLFLKEKDQLSYESVMVYQSIRMYSNLMRKMMKFCNPDVFKYTLDHLTKTHLFVREGTISGAIFHLSKEMMNRYTSIINPPDKLRISKFIQELRGRLRQSIVSFAELYYENYDKGLKYTTPYETDEGREEVTAPALENIERISTEISRRITIYGEIKRQNQEISQKLTKISGTFADDIVKQVSRPEYKDDVKLAVELFFRELTNVRQICGKEFFKMVFSLLSIKRTIKQVYFKKQISDLLLSIVKSKHQEKKFRSLTRQTQFSAITFLALYIMSFARDMLCVPNK